MKLIPVDALIRDKSCSLIDDSIVRGTQLGETTEFCIESGAKAVHIRPACPPLLFGCKYLNSPAPIPSWTSSHAASSATVRATMFPRSLDDYAKPAQPEL